MRGGVSDPTLIRNLGFGIPHMRGGVSGAEKAYPFRECIPHMRGGVSIPQKRFNPFTEYSPHAWGCFPLPRPLLKRGQVFPTCVGCF